MSPHETVEKLRTLEPFFFGGGSNARKRWGTVFADNLVVVNSKQYRLSGHVDARFSAGLESFYGTYVPCGEKGGGLRQFLYPFCKRQNVICKMPGIAFENMALVSVSP